MKPFEIVSAEMTADIRSLRPDDILLDHVPTEGALVQAGALSTQKSKDNLGLTVAISEDRNQLTITRQDEEPFGIVHYSTDEQTLVEHREIVFSPPYVGSIALQRVASKTWSVNLDSYPDVPVTVADPAGLRQFIGKAIQYSKIKQNPEPKK